MAYLEIIIGPMFSGKTNYLISIYNNIINDFYNICINSYMLSNKIYFNYLYLLDNNLSYQNSQINFYNKYKNNIVLCINYFKDTRYGNNIISSHDGNKINSINLKCLSELFKNPKTFQNYSFILINEAQFFPDLKNNVLQLIEKYNKKIFICGLDCDFKRNKFGEIWDLIPHADNLIKLNGKCNFCNEKSLFTHRLSNEQDQEVIGNDNYVPLCRYCYIKNNI